MGSRPATDAEIISSSIADPEAFEEIFRRHYDSVFRYLVARVGTDDAADLAAEVFTRAFAARNRYNTEILSARPWLYGIAANLARHRARSLRYWAHKIARLSRTDPHYEADPADQAAGRADASLQWPRLAAALDSLNNGERDVVALHTVAGLTQAETAQVLGIPEGTVKSRHHRAMARLRELLARSEASNGKDSQESDREPSDD